MCICWNCFQFHVAYLKMFILCYRTKGQKSNMCEACRGRQEPPAFTCTNNEGIQETLGQTGKPHRAVRNF